MFLPELSGGPLLDEDQVPLGVLVEGIEFAASLRVDVGDGRLDGRADSVELAGVGVKGGDNDTGF